MKLEELRLRVLEAVNGDFEKAKEVYRWVMTGESSGKSEIKEAVSLKSKFQEVRW